MPATEELRIHLRTVADTSGARETQQALREIETLGARGAAGAGAVAGAAASATNLLGDAARRAVGVFGDSIDAQREHERLVRAVGMAYGGASSEVMRFSQQLEAATGITADSALEAALSARTLVQNYGLTIAQTQKLMSVSADLARTRGIDLPAAFERVQSAARGEAEASEYLGVTLNDTYMKNQALNGSYKNTWEQLSDLEKAQARYNELLRQSAQFTGLATASTDSLDAAFRRAATSGHNLELTLGGLLKGPTIGGLEILGKGLDMLNESLSPKDPEAIRFWKFFPELFKQLQQGGGSSLDQIKAAADGANEATNRAVEAARDAKRLLELNENVPPVATVPDAALLQRLALQDQAQAAAQDLIKAQYDQVQLQQESVNLSAEEARVRASLLPAQQRMAALQRDITEQQLRATLSTLPATERLQDLQRAQQVSSLIRQTNTSLEEQQIRARMAALPATEALEDLQRAQEIARLVAQTNTSLQQNMLQARLAAMPATEALDDLRYEQQRQQLISQDRTRSAAERSAARRELRDLNRREPGVALSALEAGRGVTAAGRVSGRADIEQQMVSLADQAALATAQLAATQAQQAELEAKRSADRASLEQQLKDLAEQAVLAVAQLAVIEVQRAELEAGRAAERFNIAQQLQAIADARALAPVLDAEQANQLQQTIAAAVTQGQEAILKQILAQVHQPITLTVNFALPDGTMLTATQLIEANGQAVIPPAIQLSGLRRG